MRTLVEGRVVDVKGRPVAEATVTLDKTYRPESGDDWPLLTARTDASGRYSFGGPVIEKLREDEERPALRSTDGERASRKVEPAWGDVPMRVPDLVLVKGVRGRVELTWEDGPPASGVHINVTLFEREDEDTLSTFEGSTDDAGAFTFGPVPDISYGIAIQLKHPHGAPSYEHRERVRLAKPVRIKFQRGLTVHGRLVTRDGRPAPSFRVGPLNPAAGDPEIDELVESDADGCFRLHGVHPGEGAIGIYCPVPPLPAETADPLDLMRYYGRYKIGRAGNPVLVIPIHNAAGDLGDVVLPRLGSVEVRLLDSGGVPVREGNVFWSLAHARVGGTGVLVDEDGIARLDDVPLDRPLKFEVTVTDGKVGALQDRFSVPDAVDGRIEHRVAGPGTVIVRFQCRGTPVHVPEVLAGWLGGFGSSIHGGERTEVRGWAKPGVHPELRVRVPGYRPCVFPTVTVRDDGPTYLVADLEPL